MKRLYQQLKNVYHFFQAHAWRQWYGRPDQAMKIYGVTGTNGKTTTCHILASILGEEFGADQVGMLTTIAFWLGRRHAINATKLTTLPSRLVYRYLAQIKKAGVEQVVLEMTSHALDQNRLAGIRLAGAIILNIEREHLDYHHTLEKYAQSKLKIIAYLKPNAPLVINEQFFRQFGGPAALAGNFQTTTFNTSQAQSISTPLPGDFNKENALAASLLARALNISEPAIQRGVAAIKHVPGRMEWINAPAGFRVIIDYAVTPAALTKLYQYARQQTVGRIIGVLGAAGQRDRGKRPAMAAAVAALADELVITREDPWTEPEEQIFSDLENGLTDAIIPWQRLADRREALRYAIRQARAGDIVVVTGKGAETGMGIGQKIIPWNDRQEIAKMLLTA